MNLCQKCTWQPLVHDSLSTIGTYWSRSGGLHFDPLIILYLMCILCSPSQCQEVYQIRILFVISKFTYVQRLLGLIFL